MREQDKGYIYKGASVDQLILKSKLTWIQEPNFFHGDLINLARKYLASL